MNFFEYNNANGNVELAVPEILLISEFKALMDDSRNKCDADKTGKYHLRAFREFTYIWLAIDWKSPYSDYAAQDKHQEALKDASLTEEEFNDPIFREACRKYRNLQESNLSVKMLKAAQETVNKFIEYFNQVDPLAIDETTGKPIYKVKDIMAELSSLGKVHDELVDLKRRVEKDMEEKSKVRGNAVEGFEPNF